jgi:16S rRNA (cytidine1402-2'-O)-methyltransferase
MDRVRRASGTINVIATPIGNLGDISARALDELRASDMILCEDTRVTRNLLTRYEIDVPMMSYHQHSDLSKVEKIIEMLREGKHLALVSDAGTPTISDPGGRLIEVVKSAGFPVAVIAIPGPSAVISALSISGFPADKFLFLGFPPQKKGRVKFFQEVADAQYTCVFYESCHRITKALEQMQTILREDQEVCICREMTKRNESVYYGTVTELLAMNIPEKGECVVVVRK